MDSSNEKNEKNLKYYKYIVFLENENEREEATQFLKSWLKFFLRYLPKSAVYISHHINELPERKSGNLIQKAFSSIKLCVEHEGDIPLLNGDIKIDEK